MLNKYTEVENTYVDRNDKEIEIRKNNKMQQNNVHLAQGRTNVFGSNFEEVVKKRGNLPEERY